MFRTLLAQVQGYPGLFTACAFSGLGIPLPEDVPLLYAGFLIGEGTLSWWPTLLVTFLGVTTRDLLAYSAGRLVGARVLTATWLHRLIPRARIEHAQARIQAHGAAAVLAGRFLPGARAPLFLVAGASGVPLTGFLRYDLLGLAFLVPTMLTLGRTFGAPLLSTVFTAFQTGRITWIVGGLALMAFVLWRAWAQRRATPPRNRALR